ncbi:MAG: CoA-binding protein [Planctomycetaceae bacterium]
MNDIDAFLAGDSFAVAGASRNRAKYGNKVLRAYLQRGRSVVAINPQEREIEGVPCYPDLASLPMPVHGLSIITPPPATERLVEHAAAAGIRHIWMQPGAESPRAVDCAAALGLNCIADGCCILVLLGYRE